MDELEGNFRTEVLEPSDDVAKTNTLSLSSQNITFHVSEMENGTVMCSSSRGFIVPQLDLSAFVFAGEEFVMGKKCDQWVFDSKDGSSHMTYSCEASADNVTACSPVMLEVKNATFWMAAEFDEVDLSPIDPSEFDVGTVAPGSTCSADGPTQPRMHGFGHAPALPGGVHLFLDPPRPGWPQEWTSTEEDRDSKNNDKLLKRSYRSMLWGKSRIDNFRNKVLTSIVVQVPNSNGFELDFEDPKNIKCAVLAPQPINPALDFSLYKYNSTYKTSDGRTFNEWTWTNRPRTYIFVAASDGTPHYWGYHQHDGVNVDRTVAIEYIDAKSGPIDKKVFDINLNWPESGCPIPPSPPG